MRMVGAASSWLRFWPALAGTDCVVTGVVDGAAAGVVGTAFWGAGVAGCAGVGAGGRALCAERGATARARARGKRTALLRDMRSVRLSTVTWFILSDSRRRRPDCIQERI